ncbi:hypothetical protein TeGR_g12394 [Tetraparma gracilis]|uniref:Leucine-rich repeat domain-containing protein n=1 Tax=Tetraparma gracilis TaxID=2962635 RepID=A0ABQ6MZ77_9STRA|nr:hypothetical protein TeGR_g12394 [Tetraparma gracilis]
MSKAVMYTGKANEYEGDLEVAHVTFTDGLSGIMMYAFSGCKGLTNLSFLKDSAITIIRSYAFSGSGVITLFGMEGVREIGYAAFSNCKGLRTIEGLGCEEMGDFCFQQCTLLQSMKGWPASMTAIPVGCFYNCTGMTTVDCDLSHVTSIGIMHGYHSFAGCTSLLPPSLSGSHADPAAVLAYLKEKFRKERARPTFLFCLKHAQSNYYDRTGDPCGASRRIIMEFAGLFPA